MAKRGSKAKSGLKIVPLGDRVVLKRQDAETTTAGGIVLPDSAQDKPHKGEVVAVGEGHVKNDGTKTAYMKYDECWYCMPCEADCPTNAVTVNIPFLLK